MLDPHHHSTAPCNREETLEEQREREERERHAEYLDGRLEKHLSEDEGDDGDE